MYACWLHSHSETSVPGHQMLKTDFTISKTSLFHVKTDICFNIGLKSFMFQYRTEEFHVSISDWRVSCFNIGLKSLMFQHRTEEFRVSISDWRVSFFNIGLKSFMFQYRTEEFHYFFGLSCRVVGYYFRVDHDHPLQILSARQFMIFFTHNSMPNNHSRWNNIVRGPTNLWIAQLIGLRWAPQNKTSLSLLNKE